MDESDQMHAWWFVAIAVLFIAVGVGLLVLGGTGPGLGVITVDGIVVAALGVVSGVVGIIGYAVQIGVLKRDRESTDS